MTNFDRALQGWQNRTISRSGMNLRVAFWNVPNAKGQILLLGGMRDFAEKNTAEAEIFAQWGYSTVYLDWHHQGRSGRLPYIAPLPAHVQDFADYDADLATLWPHINPVAAVAHSMGAHNALRYWAQQGLTIPLVVTAPLLGVKLGMAEARARILAKFAVLLGWGPKRAPGQLAYARPPFADNIYSRDEARFNEMFDWMEHDEVLKKEGATFGWVSSFLASTAWLRQPATLKRIVAPVLVFATPNDPLIDGPAQQALRQIPNVTLVELTDSTHEPLRDEARIRTPVLEQIHRFIESHTATA